MKKDPTFKWDDKDFVDFYTDSANFIVLERQRSIRILLEIVAFHFPSLSGLHILDLGCGEGIITKYIYDKSPDNTFYLLDASEEMLGKAKANLSTSKSNISFSHRTFEDYSTSQSEDWKYDFVFSANAIHHLDFTQKTALYTKIYKELKPGGLFLNIDAVHPSSAHSEEIQFQMWRNWMNETLEKWERNRTRKVRQCPVPIQEQFGRQAEWSLGPATGIKQMRVPGCGLFLQVQHFCSLRRYKVANISIPLATLASA